MARRVGSENRVNNVNLGKTWRIKINVANSIRTL
jgi:hypothetical protein